MQDFFLNSHYLIDSRYTKNVCYIKQISSHFCFYDSKHINKLEKVKKRFFYPKRRIEVNQKLKIHNYNPVETTSLISATFVESPMFELHKKDIFLTIICLLRVLQFFFRPFHRWCSLFLLFCSILPSEDVMRKIKAIIRMQEEIINSKC